MKHYKVPITITVNNNGIWRSVTTEPSAVADSPEAAAAQVRSSLVTISSGTPKLIADFSHLGGDDSEK